MTSPRWQQQQQQQQLHHHHHPHFAIKQWHVSSVYSIISHTLVAFMAFHMGVLYILASMHGDAKGCNASLQAPVAEAAAALPNTSVTAECICHPPVTSLPVPSTAEAAVESTSANDDKFVPQATIGQFIAGAALIERKSFIKSFDIGVPWDRPWEAGNSHVFMIYSHNSSLPASFEAAAAETSSGSLPVFSSAGDATKNCNSVKVVLTQPQEANSCLAIVGQWESYHVHRYMRLPKDDNNADVSAKHDLRYVPRFPKALSILPQEDTLIKRNYGKILTDYIAKVPETLRRLKPIAIKAAGNDHVVVVMICNFGQAQVLFNFVCSARARGLDLSKVLLFATDQETADLATNLGLLVFNVQDAFGEMPKKAAAQFRDQTFAAMMLGKIYCVQLINMLGFDLLFQDVDVVWYKNPIDDFFKDITKTGDFDMYFQDDGSRNSYFAPYSANTGFYFVRHNNRTEYLFSMLARIGDQVISSGSHQSVLTSLMNEHASWRGLKVKVFAHDDLGERFPGGYHYHQWKNYMLDFIQGKKDPYIFHMHWTKNKDDKRKFYQQMSEWFLNEECIDQTVSTIDHWSNTSLTERCCLAQPAFQCHYRDKPSTKPCKDSPGYDVAKNISFW